MLKIQKTKIVRYTLDDIDMRDLFVELEETKYSQEVSFFNGLDIEEEMEAYDRFLEEITQEHDYTEGDLFSKSELLIRLESFIRGLRLSSLTDQYANFDNSKANSMIFLNMLTKHAEEEYKKGNRRGIFYPINLSTDKFKELFDLVMSILDNLKITDPQNPSLFKLILSEVLKNDYFKQEIMR